MRPKYKVADVLNKHQHQLDSWCANTWKSRTLHAVRKCRTAALGGHVDVCNCCDKIHLSYNSCRNRHCPTCQGHKREQWIKARESEVLDVPYFHVVFTIPHELNILSLSNPKLIYSSLFQSAWATLLGFSENPNYLGARLGMIALLHTWGQNLQLHPHLNCIVPSGGVSKYGKWKKSKNKGEFLFPVKEMSKVFRAKFVAELRNSKELIPQKLFDDLFKKQWVVFTKKPFRNTFSVIEYLGRCSHKVAISNHRITNVDHVKNTVTFKLKNYKKDGSQELQTLSQKEFTHRFSLHILPKGFTRIRHYGILSGTWKKKHLKKLQKQLAKTVGQVSVKQPVHRVCPSCKKGTLITVFSFNKARPPPQIILKQLVKNVRLP